MCNRGQSRMECSWSAIRLSLLACFLEPVLAQIRYTIPEEVKYGYTVGNIAKDLGFDVRTLVDRHVRIVSGSKEPLFHVDDASGVLRVHGRIDREEICDGNSACFINLKIAVENPLEIHYVRIDVTDINDHSPYFTEQEQRFEIAEHTQLGARFQVQAARDPDVGINSIRSYKLSQNEYFEIDVRERQEIKVPFMVLRKALDREQRLEHKLILTAIDGGNPPKTGQLNITITVLDINDNRPVFNQETYTVTLLENSPVGTVVVKVNATDLDEGSNGAIEYFLGRNLGPTVYDVFEMDSITGEIRVKGNVDFEDTNVFQLDVQASDKGQPPFTVEGVVLIRILDVNDNSPEIEVTSLSNFVLENSKPGTVVSLISVSDKDSGVNGKVLCNLSENAPFELKASFQDNMYSIITKGTLDRETVSHYDVTVTASDLGQPPLSAVKTLSIGIADVNDNRPEFRQNPIDLYMMENNPPSASIFTIQAIDKDSNENAELSYQIVREEGNNIASFFNINPANGVIHAVKSFDFETIKHLNFSVVAQDSGDPPLSSTVTVNVFLLDQNDNPPIIMFPINANGSTEGIEEIPRNVQPGFLVCKVRAYDSDIGYNGWLLFSLQEVTDHTLFGLDRYTGQIRTLRAFTETDESKHKLIILVKDNGNVSLSATATVFLDVVEPREAIAASDIHVVNEQDENDVTFYLMITLGSVSVLFVISIIVLIAMQCSKSTDYTSKYLQDANYDGTLCHSIQYRSGDKRYMLVGPRMSVSSAVVPGSNMNTLKSGTCYRKSTLEVSNFAFHLA